MSPTTAAQRETARRPYPRAERAASPTAIPASARRERQTPPPRKIPSSDPHRRKRRTRRHALTPQPAARPGPPAAAGEPRPAPQRVVRHRLRQLPCGTAPPNRPARRSTNRTPLQASRHCRAVPGVRETGSRSYLWPVCRVGRRWRSPHVARSPMIHCAYPVSGGETLIVDCATGSESSSISFHALQTA